MMAFAFSTCCVVFGARGWFTSDEHHSRRLSSVSLSPKDSHLTDDKILDYVDPLIGTGGHGHTYPGATVPWGMVQATPWARPIETRGDHSSDPWDATRESAFTRSWDWQAGYHTATRRKRSARFLGVAHSALSGAGTGELGELRIAPCCGPEEGSDPLALTKIKAVEASPGYVKLVAEGFEVESTASKRGAVHRFSALDGLRVDVGAAEHDFFGLSGTSEWRANFSEKDPAGQRLEGCSTSTVTGFGGALAHLCFVVGLSSSTQEVVLAEWEQKPHGFQIKFGAKGPVVVRVGVSRTDIEHARVAFREEIDGRLFEDVHAAARVAWGGALGVVKVDMDINRLKEFYTGLYHTMLGPVLLSDSDGTYRFGSGNFQDDASKEKFIKHIGTEAFSTFSLWDTFRGVQPLMNLLHPQKSADFADSLLAMQDPKSGAIPTWPLLQSPTDFMVGDPGTVTLATMALQGIVSAKNLFPRLVRSRNASVEIGSNKEKMKLDRDVLAFNLLKTSLVHLDDEEPVSGNVRELAANVTQEARAEDVIVDVHNSWGGREGVSEFLEQSYADYCVSRVAERLGYHKQRELFARRAKVYQVAWDNQTHLFSPFKYTYNGKVTVESISKDTTSGFTEANAEQYSWGVQFDFWDQIKQRGGKKRYIEELDFLFTRAAEKAWTVDVDGANYHGFSGGNEVTMHTPYLYAIAGFPTKTEALVDFIVKNMYSAMADGLPGNDDFGQQSSWLVWSMLGLYPANPCAGEFVLGRPFVREATMSVRGGILRIVAHNQNDDHKYVQKVTWNGKDLDKHTLTFEQLSAGGDLEFTMGQEPKNFATTFDLRPESVTKRSLDSWKHGGGEFEISPNMQNTRLASNSEKDSDDIHMIRSATQSRENRTDQAQTKSYSFPSSMTPGRTSSSSTSKPSDFPTPFPPPPFRRLLSPPFLRR